MANITISQTEYHQLINKALRYEYLTNIVMEDVFAPPTTQNTKAIVDAFASTKQYSQSFLKSFEKALKRSKYFKSGVTACSLLSLQLLLKDEAIIDLHCLSG